MDLISRKQHNARFELPLAKPLKLAEADSPCHLTTLQRGIMSARALIFNKDRGAQLSFYFYQLVRSLHWSLGRKAEEKEGAIYLSGPRPPVLAFRLAGKMT